MEPDDGACIRVTVVIPMYNETARIPGSIAHWRASRIFERFPLVIVDDGSCDGSVGLVQPLAQEYPGVRIVQTRSHRGKPWAIREALDHVFTPYVLCLDADIWFPGEPGELEAELSRLIAAGMDLVAFRLHPGHAAPSVLADLQSAEFAFLTDVARRVFGHVGNVNGATSFWRTGLLRDVLAVHSGEFEGDDLECTLIAHQMRAMVGASPLTFRKFAKTSLRALAAQRVRIWDVGLFRAFSTLPPGRLPVNNDTMFLRWYALFEGVLHPVRVVAFLLLLLSLASGPFAAGPFQAVRLCLALVYGAAMALCLGQWWRYRRRIAHGRRLLGLLCMLWLYPSAFLWLATSGRGVLVYWALWSVSAALYGAAISDRLVRSRSLLLSPILPLYFFLVTIVFRTAGMALWASRSVGASRRSRSGTRIAGPRHEEHPAASTTAGTGS